MTDSELIKEAKVWLGHAENNGIDGGFNTSIDECDYDLIQRLTTALKAQQKAWRPIESAPKDGTVFIGLYGNHLAKTQWSRTHGTTSDGKGIITDKFNERWSWQEYSREYDSWIWVIDDNSIPTHWMPLPSRPKTEPQQ